MKDINDMESYEALRFAIVERAAQDYMKWKQDLYYFAHGTIYKRSSCSTTTSERVEYLRKEIYDLRKFFLSQWFFEICSMDGEYILNKLDDDFEEWTHYNYRKKSIGV